MNTITKFTIAAIALGIAGIAPCSLRPTNLNAPAIPAANSLDGVNIMCIAGIVSLQNTTSDQQTVNYAILHKNGSTSHDSAVLPPFGFIVVSKIGSALSAWIEP
jgi:hypothetical protein